MGLGHWTRDKSGQLLNSPAFRQFKYICIVACDFLPFPSLLGTMCPIRIGLRPTFGGVSQESAIMAKASAVKACAPFHEYY
jgi:hypothetical protein